MRFTPLLLPSRQGNLGVLTLNNPKAFHALTLDMVYALRDVLQQWYQDDSLHAILLTSSTSEELKKPVFCAGGDVKSLYYSGKGIHTDEKAPSSIDDATPSTTPHQCHGQGHTGLMTADFFRHEYTVNYMMATCTTKPQISIWNGLCYGGGVGLSIHGAFRVATQHAQLSMPETSIGLFPDIGSTWWMTRLLPSWSMAVYMALTGQQLQAEDLLWAGLATHYVSAAKVEDLQYALADASKRNESVTPVLMSFHEMPNVDPVDSHLARHQHEIDVAFGNATASVLDILQTLETMETDFAQATLATLHKVSPTSLRVTLEGLRRGAEMTDIGQAFCMEYRMSQAFMRHKDDGDFYEGIRAALIDKDRMPVWKPASVELVTDEMVASYFAPLECEWEPPTMSSSAVDRGSKL